MYHILFLILLFACSSPEDNSSHRETISGRDNGKTLIRNPLYQVKVPNGWIRVDSDEKESIQDTTKPLATFFIEDQKNKIKVTVHNFPVDSMEERIPPMAQISRWKKQFSQLIPSSESITSHATGGFSGLLYEASGKIEGNPTSLMGFSMQIAPEYFKQPQYEDELEEEQKRQMKGDYTIKVLGPPEMIEFYRHEIITFANSFGLLRELAK